MLFPYFLTQIILIHNIQSTDVSITRTSHSPDFENHYRKFVQNIYSRESNNFETFENDEGLLYVPHQDNPVEFEDHKYYWSLKHEDLKEVTHVCEYRFTSDDSQELLKTRFLNGTKANSLYHYCNFPYACLGIECLVETRVIVAFALVICLFIVLTCIRKCVMREMKEIEKIRDRCTRPEYVPGSRFMPGLAPSSSSQEPPPPSYNMVFSTSPPTYESVVRDKVIYTLPSYSSIA